VPLIEIVTKPVTGAGERAPEVARAYVTALREVLESLNVSDVKMEQGSLRCDANVSLMAIGATEFGTRTETKNVNSLRSVEVAGPLRNAPPGAILADGGSIVQETRHFHEVDGSTAPGRVKRDRRGLPLLPRAGPEPVAPEADRVEQLRATIPNTRGCAAPGSSPTGTCPPR